MGECKEARCDISIGYFYFRSFRFRRCFKFNYFQFCSRHSLNDRFDSIKLSFRFSAILHSWTITMKNPRGSRKINRRQSLLDVRHHQGYHTGFHGARDKICTTRARGRLNWKVKSILHLHYISETNLFWYLIYS